MPSDFHSKKYILPKYSKADYSALMKLIHNSLTFELSDAAKYRLHVLNHYYKHGWRSAVDAFGLGKSTLYDWKARFEQSGKKLSSLVPISTKPKKVRQMQTDWRLIKRIKTLRQEHGHLSKYKLKIFLDVYAKELDIPSISSSTIGKVIKRRNLFFESRTKKKRRIKPGTTRLRYAPKQLKPGYLETDTIHIYMNGMKYYFITVIDIATKYAGCKIATTHSSRQAMQALVEFREGYSAVTRIVQTDNGSEFLGVFDQYCQGQDIKHEFIYPRSPKIHGVVERFNRTLKEEFIQRQAETIYDTTPFKRKLDRYLNWYNTQRPHYSLKYSTPLEYLKNYQTRIPKCG